LCHKIIQIERPSVHRDLAVRRARPLLPWPIPIKFDAIVVGIAQVKRLTDAMIARAVERNPRRDQATKRVGEFGSCWVENGKMIKTGPAGRRGFPPALSHVFNPMW